MKHFLFVDVPAGRQSIMLFDDKSAEFDLTARQTTYFEVSVHGLKLGMADVSARAMDESQGRSALSNLHVQPSIADELTPG